MTCISLARHMRQLEKYLKHKDHKTLVHIKDQLEKYIEINSGFRKIYIQFDFS